MCRFRPGVLIIIFWVLLVPHFILADIPNTTISDFTRLKSLDELNTKMFGRIEVDIYSKREKGSIEYRFSGSNPYEVYVGASLTVKELNKTYLLKDVFTYLNLQENQKIAINQFIFNTKEKYDCKGASRARIYISYSSRKDQAKPFVKNICMDDQVWSNSILYQLYLDTRFEHKYDKQISILNAAKNRLSLTSLADLKYVKAENSDTYRINIELYENIKQAFSSTKNASFYIQTAFPDPKGNLIDDPQQSVRNAYLIYSRPDTNRSTTSHREEIRFEVRFKDKAIKNYTLRGRADKNGYIKLIYLLD